MTNQRKHVPRNDIEAVSQRHAIFISTYLNPMNSPSHLHPFLLLTCMAALSLYSCSSQPRPDTTKEIEALALLQKQEQDAHLQESPALLVNMLHDTLTQIKNGEVSYYTKDQMTERFISYFESVEFIKWEDARPPIYTISDDGSMAHILIRKHVVVDMQQDTAGRRETTDLAWTELWRKKEGRWKMYSVTTTEVRE